MTGRTGRSGSDVALAPGAAPSDGKIAAYHAIPASGRGPAVLVVDEARALGDFARDVCDRLARAGFAALAVDLPAHGDASPAIETGVRHLLDDDATDGSRVGVLGFEDGAVPLFQARDAARRIGCLVACGGIPRTETDDAPGPWLAVPTLLVFGEEDARAEGARELAQTPAAPRLCLVPGAGARFMNPARADLHVAPAAASAWDAILAFLGASL